MPVLYHNALLHHNYGITHYTIMYGIRYTIMSVLYHNALLYHNYGITHYTIIYGIICCTTMPVLYHII